ncbi:MAG: hypothetical protein O2960_13925 [Verrucomicrobia bacterium]|nr:hypothetical protein [Verrucomicrobiota bacterium]
MNLITDACRKMLDHAKDATAAEGKGATEMRNLATSRTTDLSIVVVLSACEDGKRAREWEGFEHGLFTKALLDAWIEAKAKSKPMYINGRFKDDLAERMGRLAEKAGWPKDEQCPMIKVNGSVPYSDNNDRRKAD